MSQDTSATQTTWYPRLITHTWQPEEKYCGGRSKCGSPCHKGMNVMILRAKTPTQYAKIYCRECDITFESDMKACEVD